MKDVFAGTGRHLRAASPARCAWRSRRRRARNRGRQRERCRPGPRTSPPTTCTCAAATSGISAATTRCTAPPSISVRPSTATRRSLGHTPVSPTRSASSPSTASTPADSAFPLARKAAEKALSLDSTLAEAHTTLGLILKSTGEWEPAAAEFRRGLALDSTYATGHQWYAEVLIITGRVHEAVAELERARDLEPLSPVINAELGYTLGLAGTLPGRHPGWSTRGGARLDALDRPRVPRVHPRVRRRLPAAVVRLPPRRAAGPGHRPARRGARLRFWRRAGKSTVLARCSRRRGAREKPRRVADRPRHGLHRTRRSRRRAQAGSTRAAQEKDPWLYAMSINAPIFDAIRDDPRFADAAKTMKLDPAVMAKPSKGT